MKKKKDQLCDISAGSFEKNINNRPVENIMKKMK